MAKLKQKKSVGDPNDAYESLQRQWTKSRAILTGQAAARSHDSRIDTLFYSNLLIPFSPFMSQAQYNFYLAESELPGLVSQYAKVLKGGLLRKPPSLELPKVVPEEAIEWLMFDFTSDSQPLTAFLEDIITEELTTSRAVVTIDYPAIDEVTYDALTPEDKNKLKPYPVLWKAENVINWRVGKHPITGVHTLQSLTLRSIEETYDDDENKFHPSLNDVVIHYMLDSQGFCVIERYRRSKESDNNTAYMDGQKVVQFQSAHAPEEWVKDTADTYPMIFGKPLPQIPAFFMNGSVEPNEPLLTPLVDREVALYNKISRRNHLLYGTATFTPVLKSAMPDSDFQQIVQSGLGSWIRIGPDDSIDVLSPPTESLKDMEAAISATVDDLARMGIRILAPESGGDSSGIALTIRNSAQIAQLGTLNTRISNAVKSMIKLMLEWRYGSEIKEAEVDFTLSADFNPVPIGADWLRLITEWYEARIIPRSTFIEIAKINDILPMDYNDEDGQKELKLDLNNIGVGPPPTDPRLFEEEGIDGTSKPKIEDK